MAYVICDQDMQELSDLQTRRDAASRWYAQYRTSLTNEQISSTEANHLTDADVTELVHALR